MADMNERLVAETKKMQTAERRRKLEIEGYYSDLVAMKKKVTFYQKYIMKLKKLVEEDQSQLANVIDEEDQEEDMEGEVEERR